MGGQSDVGEPTTIVIFGATGDLARRKLIPALFQLACKGRLPDRFHIVGFARQEYSDDRFREFMGDGVREFGQLALRTDEWTFNNQAIPEAYERLLQDSLEGDPSLFIRSDHIEEAWRIVAPLLERQENPATPPPQEYEPGSWGPTAADKLLSQEGHMWQGVCGVHGDDNRR